MKKFKYNFFEPSIEKKKETTIIFYHGYGTYAADCNDVAEELTTEGYAVIIPEIIYHDTRNPLENPFKKETMQQYFWKTIFQSIEEFDEFLEGLGIPEHKIIVAGSSMGGFIANGIFAVRKNLGGLININGSGSFLLSEKLFRKMDGRPSIGFEEEQMLKIIDPFRKTECQTPILLMHGDSDKTIPIEGQEDYFRFLTKVEDRGNVEFKVYKDIDHQFSSEMLNEAISWLNKNK